MCTLNIQWQRKVYTTLKKYSLQLKAVFTDKYSHISVLCGTCILLSACGSMTAFNHWGVHVLVLDAVDSVEGTSFTERDRALPSHQ